MDRQVWVEQARLQVCRLLRPLLVSGQVQVSAVLPEFAKLGPMFHVFIVDEHGGRRAAFFLRWCDVHTRGAPMFGLDWVLEPMDVPEDSYVWDDIPLALGFANQS